jgi:integrase
MPKLTAIAVENLRPDDQRREIPDTLLPGLYIVVQPSGTKSWAVRYRHLGRTRKLTLGPYPRIDLKAARALGAKALRNAAEGDDPGQKKRHRPDSVGAAIGQFTERHLRRNYRPRPLREAERMLRVHVLPAWRDRTIDSITRRDVRDMLDKIIDGGAPITANRVHSLVRKFFNWAVEHEILATSPVNGLKPPATESARDRILSDGELKTLWQATTQIDPVNGAMLRLLILTGQRRGEAAGLERSEIDLAKRLWSLPKERTKNGRAHDVPLSQQAIAVIEAVPRISDRHVFSITGKAPINGFGKPKQRLDKLCGFSDWVVHDIRRSVASGMARLGVGLPVIEKVLNHVSGSFAGIVGVYQRHEFSAEKRAALEAWATHVESLVSTKPTLALLRGDR